MSEASQLLVRRIKDGTVIDHIESGKALLVLTALAITGREGNVVTMALTAGLVFSGFAMQSVGRQREKAIRQ